MLHRLPAELALHILSYLPLSGVAHSAAISKEWSRLVNVNEQQIYRNAAVLHGFVSPRETVNADIAIRAGGWKDLCRRVLQYERSWRGRAPVIPKELSASGKSVHRIKVDEQRRFVITTIQRGGLYVTDLDTNIVLWSLPRGYVADFAHCEYEHGFLVFTRPDSCYEVWCTADQADVQTSEAYPPNDVQMQIAEVAATTHVATPARARFKPHALLRCPDPTRALRLSYPTLFVAGTNSAFLWDIVSGTLVQTITQLQRQPGNLGVIRYVEVTPDYAIICGSESFRMFSREDGTIAFQLEQDDFPGSKRRLLPPLRAAATINELVPMRIGPAIKTRGSEEFMASHVTASGDLVLLTCGANLIVYKNIEGIISGDAERDRSVLRLDFNSKTMYATQSATYLAVDGDRIALSTYEGIFLISICGEVDPTSGAEPSDIASSVSVARLAQFKNRQWLRFISCLQLTPRGVYFNWKPSGALPAAQVRRGNQIDNPMGMSVQIEGIGEFGIGQGLVQAVQDHATDPEIHFDGDDELLDPEDLELPPLEGLGDVDEEPLLNGHEGHHEGGPSLPEGEAPLAEANVAVNGAHHGVTDVDVLFDTAEAEVPNSGPSTTTMATARTSVAEPSNSTTSLQPPFATIPPPSSTSSTAGTSGTALPASPVAVSSATNEEVDEDEGDNGGVHRSTEAGTTASEDNEASSSPSMPTLMEMSNSDHTGSNPDLTGVGDEDTDIIDANDDSDWEDEEVLDPLWPAVQTSQLTNDQVQILLNEFLFPMTLSTVHCVLFDGEPLS